MHVQDVGDEGNLAWALPRLHVLEEQPLALATRALGCCSGGEAAQQGLGYVQRNPGQTTTFTNSRPHVHS